MTTVALSNAVAPFQFEIFQTPWLNEPHRIPGGNEYWTRGLPGSLRLEDEADNFSSYQDLKRVISTLL